MATGSLKRCVLTRVRPIILAQSNPAYRSTFDKVLRNPQRAFHTFTRDESEAFAANRSRARRCPLPRVRLAT